MTDTNRVLYEQLENAISTLSVVPELDLTRINSLLTELDSVSTDHENCLTSLSSENSLVTNCNSVNEKYEGFINNLDANKSLWTGIEEETVDINVSHNPSSSGGSSGGSSSGGGGDNSGGGGNSNAGKKKKKKDSDTPETKDNEDSSSTSDSNNEDSSSTNPPADNSTNSDNTSSGDGDSNTSNQNNPQNNSNDSTNNNTNTDKNNNTNTNINSNNDSNKTDTPNKESTNNQGMRNNSTSGYYSKSYADYTGNNASSSNNGSIDFTDKSTDLDTSLDEKIQSLGADITKVGKKGSAVNNKEISGAINLANIKSSKASASGKDKNGINWLLVALAIGGTAAGGYTLKKKLDKDPEEEQEDNIINDILEGE